MERKIIGGLIMLGMVIVFIPMIINATISFDDITSKKTKTVKIYSVDNSKSNFQIRQTVNRHLFDDEKVFTVIQDNGSGKQFTDYDCDEVHIKDVLNKDQQSYVKIVNEDFEETVFLYVPKNYEIENK